MTIAYYASKEYIGKDTMQAGREVVDFTRSDFCAKCGRRLGDHIDPKAMRNGRYAGACVFEKKFYPA